MKQFQPGQAVPMQVKMEDTTPFTCAECSHDVFAEKIQVRIVSAILSPTGQEQPIERRFLACDKCGWEVGTPPKENSGD